MNFEKESEEPTKTNVLFWKNSKREVDKRCKELKKELEECKKEEFKRGYHKCMHEFNIVHGDSAEKFMKDFEDRNNGKISAKQKKFIEEADEIFRKVKLK